MAKTSFVIGKGTKVSIAMLPEGSTIEPVAATLTSEAALTEKDVTAPAAITLTSALGAGVLIPAGSYVSFVAPTTGKSVLVQLASDATAGDTELDVTLIPEDIAASSVAVYPLRLAGRTAANLGRTGNRISSVSFDDDGYSSGMVASLEQTLELPGNFLPSDSAFRTVETAFLELRQIFVTLEMPKPSAAYSKGRTYKGVCSITDLPLDIAADGVISGNISLTWEGKPDMVDEVPV